MSEPDLIVAAGAVVVRKGPEVLLVHRPKYDDWSFPKGKLDPGEHVTTEAVQVRRRTGTLVVMRHAKARSRRDWDGNDRKRPLTSNGRLQAEQVVPVLGAYGVQRVVSSSSRRCCATVSPFADVAELDVELTDVLAEEDARADAVEGLVHRLLERKEPAVLCSHRPVLPMVYDALGVADPKLAAGAMLVVHH